MLIVIDLSEVIYIMLVIVLLLVKIDTNFLRQVSVEISQKLTN